MKRIYQFILGLIPLSIYLNGNNFVRGLYLVLAARTFERAPKDADLTDMPF